MAYILLWNVVPKIFVDLFGNLQLQSFADSGKISKMRPPSTKMLSNLQQQCIWMLRFV